MGCGKQPLGTEPADQRHEIAMAAVVLEGHAIVGGTLALDDELPFPPRMKAAENLHEFRVDWNVVFRREGFRTEVFGRRDGITPSSQRNAVQGSLSISLRRRPAIAPRRKILNCSGLLSASSSRALEQRLHVETGAIVRHVNPLDFHPGEGDGIRKLHQVTDPRDDLRSEKRAGSPDGAVR